MKILKLIHMKTKYLIPVLIIILASCRVKDDLSDAYGNFEVDQVIVSAEANGKLLVFKVEEGKSMKTDEVVAIIDTIDFVLKRKQLFAQKTAISSKVENIQSQIEVQEQQKKNLAN